MPSNPSQTNPAVDSQHRVRLLALMTFPLARRFAGRRGEGYPYVVCKGGCDEDAFLLFHFFPSYCYQRFRFGNGTDCDGVLIHELAVLPYKFPHIDTVVVMCGDGHILHSIRSLREMGKKVVLISPKNTINHVLKQNCDEYHDYFIIISKNHVKSDIISKSSKSEQNSKTSKVTSSDDKPQSSESNEKWAQNLFSGIVQRARVQLQEIEATHAPEPLDSDILKALQVVIETRRQSLRRR